MEGLGKCEDPLQDLMTATCRRLLMEGLMLCRHYIEPTRTSAFVAIYWRIPFAIASTVVESVSPHLVYLWALSLLHIDVY